MCVFIYYSVSLYLSLSISVSLTLFLSHNLSLSLLSVCVCVFYWNMCFTEISLKICSPCFETNSITGPGSQWLNSLIVHWVPVMALSPHSLYGIPGWLPHPFLSFFSCGFWVLCLEHTEGFLCDKNLIFTAPVQLHFKFRMCFSLNKMEIITQGKSDTV